MSNELTRRIAQEHAGAVESLPSGVVARARRHRAIDALVARGLPSSRDENWRYANLRSLERVRFAPAPAQADPAPEQLPPPIPGYARYVFIDGLFSAAASSPASPRPGVAVHAASRAPGAGAAAAGAAGIGPTGAEAAEAGKSTPDSAFALLNEAFALDSAEIDVGAPAAGAEPACIEVVFAASAPGQQGASYPRLRVTAAPHTRLRLIERHSSLGGDMSFIDTAVEVQAHDGAAIDHYRVQQLGARAVWMDTLSASVGRSATYRLHGINLGAQSARSTVHVHLRGDGAQLALHAVSAGDRQQVLDQYAVVDHAAPHTRTEESFRGIAAGRARVAFNGKIIVRPGAHGADSSQSLRGLLAGADAEIDVRPQLEIYTDDVRCSHGATAGKLDETMLFYLLSRGLDRDTAKLLLKWAFLEDVVSRIAVAALRRQIEQSLAGQIQESDTLKELL
jgi:Fe-S cluster assembly protein SufD